MKATCRSFASARRCSSISLTQPHDDGLCREKLGHDLSEKLGGSDRLAIAHDMKKGAAHSCSPKSKQPQM
jgi:hypothetical protein